MTPPLPIEAQERALDHLWNDPPSLCKCALVCKNWSPRCRHLLYTSFWIHDRRTVDVIATCSHTKQQLDSLYSIEVIQEEGDPYWHIVPSLFGARMDTMRVMKFAHMDWTKCRPHSTYFILMGQAKSLTQLFLYDCTFRAFSDLRHILSNLQSLADLRMNRITWSGPNVVVPATPSSAKRPVARPPLRRLLLRGFSLVNLRTLLIWLLESRMPSIWEIPYLELISMDSEIQDENVSEIAKFLTVLWPSAVHLGVSDWAVDVVKSINVQAPNHVCYDMCCEKENGMSCARMKVLLYDDGYKMSSRLPTHVSSLWAKKFNFAGSYLAAPTGHYYTHQYDDVIYSRVHHVALTPDCSNSNARVRCFSPDGYYIAIYGCHNGSSRIGQSSENLRTWDIQIWNVASRTIIKSLTKQLSAAISQRKISIGGPIHIEHLYDIFKKTKTDAKSRWGLSRRMILRTFRKIIDQASEAKLMQLKRHKIFKEMMTIIELQDSWREIREHLALHPCAMRTELQSELTHLVMREILRAILYADRPPQSESMDLKICQIFMELASEEPQAKFVESETREVHLREDGRRRISSELLAIGDACD
ncbi:hypothetical protein OBBRIDRAFT_267110 [Obba rivulosa]|uniref:F-box domain-containing protein n=1 Tax=Obba rivulosa TaxID=1052685 RepID=A0A8E2DQE0_9APHY|nr:hypothetical protein OBBRIDRAFT_267110 [Obba rivulosa]